MRKIYIEREKREETYFWPKLLLNIQPQIKKNVETKNG